jgi:hypothetical protein
MLKFLTTLLLALIIFIPACMFVSKFFRLSQQAETNFVEFVGTIQEIEKTIIPINDAQTKLLILDDATAIAYFEKDVKEVTIAVDAEFPLTDYTIHILKPSFCKSAKPCICLLQKPEFDVTWWKPGYDTVTITDNNAPCYEINTQLKVDTCNLGKPHNVASYTCQHGFFIERHLAEDSSWAVTSYFELQRRTLFQLTKKGDHIILKDTSTLSQPTS